ncbi:MAG: hydrolase [Gammaproteobacteria bacterium]|nr:hydrolase [Gammaproteobacteria bacterium]NIR97535.1 hydrolase [Gammaproteobacteria bacterium]NIT63168.1 hydrolase [Gammaproteobacteria bacterium]NIV20117.1 hydrolase [Gammaproteobacteria bacterium]NIX11418.1 hydrolase [Gammaproteobacteria bacterium]
MIVPSDFVPARWLPGPHLQTAWPNVSRPPPRVRLLRERLELPDGDFLDLDRTTRESGPIVLVLHGLEGSSSSPYAAGLLKAVHARGWRGVLMHARGCSGEPNRLPRRYHAGDTGDLAYVFDELRRRAPGAAIAAVGYSLGGNVLLNWLAQARPPLAGAVAVSVPFDLDATTRRLESGLSRLYQWVLLRRIYGALGEKHRRTRHPLAHRLVPRPRTLRALDDAYTAPLHGFRDAADYYRRASCRPKLREIRMPVRILQAQDDPFTQPGSLPATGELSEWVTLELSPGGGHVGFVSGSPWRPRYWLEERIPEYLASVWRSED